MPALPAPRRLVAPVRRLAMDEAKRVGRAKIEAESRLSDTRSCQATFAPICDLWPLAADAGFAGLGHYASPDQR
jgi:hypothetical protein